MSATSSPGRATPTTPLSSVRIPFVTTSFADNLFYYLLLWPVWWLMGIEQILLPFFLGWEFVRSLIQQRAQFTLNRTTLWALLLAVWAVVPIYHVDPFYLDLFVKEVATLVSQFFILFLFWNQVRSADQWWRVSRGLEVLALYVALGSLVFLSGIWQSDFLSVLGRLLPSGLVESSSFFESIAIRAFGATDLASGVLEARVSSFSLKYSGLSMISLLLIPYIVWRLEASRGIWRWISAITLVGLLTSLLFAESRVAYAAFFAGLALYVTLRSGLFRGDNKPLSIAAGLMAGAAFLVAVYFAYSTIVEIFQLVVFDWRPGSFFVRFRIYEETFRLLPEHWLAGWGTSIRIPNAPNNYSAGTHSSLLGMLFQHGIFGLLLYLLLWLSIWRVTFRGLQRPGQSKLAYTFWVAVAASFLAFNIRETFDSWWWDQLTTIVVWTMWGLTFTASKAFVTLERPSDPVHRSAGKGQSE